MDLKHWLEATPEGEQRDAARRAGTKVVYLHQIARGVRSPSPALCGRLLAEIPELTLRELRPDLADLCDQVYRHRKPHASPSVRA